MNITVMNTRIKQISITECVGKNRILKWRVGKQTTLKFYKVIAFPIHWYERETRVLKKKRGSKTQGGDIKMLDIRKLRKKWQEWRKIQNWELY